MRSERVKDRRDIETLKRQINVSQVRQELLVREFMNKVEALERENAS